MCQDLSYFEGLFVIRSNIKRGRNKSNSTGVLGRLVSALQVIIGPQKRSLVRSIVTRIGPPITLLRLECFFFQLFVTVQRRDELTLHGSQRRTGSLPPNGNSAAQPNPTQPSSTRENLRGAAAEKKRKRRRDQGVAGGLSPPWPARLPTRRSSWPRPTNCKSPLPLHLNSPCSFRCARRVIAAQKAD